MTGPRVVELPKRFAPGDGTAARPVYFGAMGRQLFGWYHAAPQPTCAVVICAPIGDESTGWHRASRHWAASLAKAGIAVLRFDYDGTGDSFGSLDDPGRVRAWSDSVDDAVDFLRTTSGAPRLVVAGIRLGATLAMSAARDGRVHGLILWAPFATGRAYVREGRAFTRLMGSADGSTSDIEQFGGLALKAETVRELEAFDPLERAAALALPVLLVPRDEASVDTALRERLTKAGANVDRQALPGYGSVITDAHQGEVPVELITGTIRWLDEHFHSPSGVGSESVSPAGALPEFRATARSNGVEESPVRIGSDGLFGVLSRPTAASPRQTAVVLVNSGAVYRVGPNRLYVTLAREWSALGYTVLRVDLGGLGDSPAPPDGEENRPYPDHAVRDVESAVAALRGEGVERIVVGGLCSGAHTTFHAALRLDGLAGVMMMNPIVFYWKPSDPLDVGAWRLYVESQHYKQSAMRWGSWVRVLKGKVNIAYVFRIALRRGFEIARAKLTAVWRGWQSHAPAGEDAGHDLGRIARKGTDVLLLFSAGDPGLDFLTLNHARELSQLQRGQNFRLHVVGDADHTFSSLDARLRASSLLTDHLLARHP